MDSTLIRIRFITDPGFVSAAIRDVTNSEFSHTEIVGESGDTYIGAHSDGGVEQRPLDYCKPTFERRYAVPVSLAQFRSAMDYAKSKIGTPYNFKDIAGILFHVDLDARRRLICSQFVFDVFEAGGIKLLNVLPGYSHLVTPETLHLSPYLIGRSYFQTEIPKVVAG